jgi:hypothetical protein
VTFQIKNYWEGEYNHARNENYGSYRSNGNYENYESCVSHGSYGSYESYRNQETGLWQVQ